jgi:hypothetical protein
MTQPQPAGDLRQQINAGLDTLGRHTQASRAVFFGDGISPPAPAPILMTATGTEAVTVFVLITTAAK